MNTDFTLIDKVPEFKPNVDTMLLDKLSPEQKYIVESLAVLRQQGAWACETAREAYNVSVTNAKQIQQWKEKFSSPMAILLWIVGVAFVAFVGAFAQKLVTGGL